MTPASPNPSPESPVPSPKSAASGASTQLGTLDPGLGTIRTPARQRWREIRIRVLPGLVFFAVLGVVVLMWNAQLAAPSVVGEVEAISANLIATRSGLLSELNVERFQKVARGQTVGRVIVLENEVLQASLNAVEQDMKVLQARIAQDSHRNELNYEQLQLNWLARRAELAIARANLQAADTEFQFSEGLFQAQLLSREARDVARSAQERARVEVGEKEKLVADASESLKRLETSPGVGDPNQGLISAAIAAQEAKLRLLEAPMVLTAPMDGLVSVINHRAGEKIMAGDPIASITALHSDRIVGYVRQPLTVVPQVGDEVQVRTRGSVRKTALARVLQVGSQLQTVTSPLRLRGYDTAQERGLPFLVNLPPGLNAYPGELVDLILRKPGVSIVQP